MSERRVIIHRNRLFVPNEAFIVSQASHLRRYRVLLSGLQADGRGEMPGDLQRALLTDMTSLAALWSAGLKVARVPPRPLLRRLEEFHPDLFHVHFGADAFWSLPIAAKLRVPLVVTFHGYDVNQKASSGLAVAAYVRVRSAVFDRATRIIAVSDFLKRRLIEAGCPAEKIVRHYIGVDTAYFRRQPGPEPPPAIAFVGRLVSFKGCEILLEAVSTMKRQPKVLVVGSGPEEERLRRLARTLRVDAEFLGSGTPALVRSVLARSSVFCLPTYVSDEGHEESLSIVTLEAQSMGVPVVSTTVGGVPEAVTNGETGILVPPRDAAATAEALERLLTDDALRERMSAAGRRHVEAKFDIVAQTSELEAIYDSVIAR